MRSRVCACVLLGCSLLVACGGGGNSSAKSASGSTIASAGSTPTVAKIDKTIATLLEVGSGQRGKKEDAPGKVRFANYLSANGKSQDIDVWWGQPNEGEKAATLKSGEVSAYVTPRRAKGFDDAVYSVTAVGSVEVLWSWDRFGPKQGTQRTVIWYYGDKGEFTESARDESATLINSFTNRPQFAAPDAGKIRLHWSVIGTAIEQQDKLLVVTAGGRCLTNGSGIADDTGNQIQDEDTFQVAPETKLTLADSCDGAPISEVTAPASGRATLFAYLDPAGAPKLALIPVSDRP